jgi:glycosyltransferase involved in cell wall biosynthesis
VTHFGTITEEVINNVVVKRFKIAPAFLANKWINKLYRVVLNKIPINYVKYLTTVPTVLDMYSYAIFGQYKKYDIVHVTSAPFTILFYIAKIVAERTGAKLIITPFVHLGENTSDPIRKLYLKKEVIPLYNAADSICVQTNAEQEALQAYFAEYKVFVPSSKFFKLGMGISPEQLKVGKGSSFRKKYGISSKQPIVFFVGAKVTNKGILNLIEAMKILWARGVDAKLVLAGNESKDFRCYWMSLEKTVKNNILNLINVSDKEKWDLFNAGDIFSMVSKSDSFGIVYLEAWFNHKPVIGCDLPVISEIIRDNIDGKLVPFNNIETIANTIEMYLTNKKVRRDHGENGYKKVISDFTWESKFKIFDNTLIKLTQE